MSRKQSRRAGGFSLIELMIALVVVGILMVVALPAYRSQAQKTKRTLVQAEMLKILSRQEQFFVNNRVYSTTLAPLGFADPYVINSNGAMVDATATDRIYSISFASSSSTAFVLQAVPQLEQGNDSRCGTLKVDHTGARSVTGSSSAAHCW